MTKKKNLKVTLAAFAALTAMASSQIPVQAAMYNGWSKQPSGDWNLYKGGVKTTGWQQDDGKWYYMTNSGNMLKNAWAQDSSGRWFFLDSDGAMVSNGWAQDRAGKWFYLGSDGAMISNGWAQDSSKCWFYLGATGEMVTSQWVEYNGNMYYLNDGGDMAANTTTPDGFFVDASGVRIISGNIEDLSDGGSHTGNYLITADGTYGNADEAKVTTINGNVAINMPDATENDTINLQNLKVTGTITVNFGAGTINTNKVTGNDVKVENVGSHCFNVGPGSIFERFAVADKNNDAKIKVDRAALLRLLIVSSGGNIETPTNVASIQKIVLDQKYLNKEVTPPPVTLAGLVPQLQIAGQSNLQISQGTVLLSVSAGAGATISGPGRVGDIQLINPNITVYLNNPTIGIVDILQQATDSHVVIPSGTSVGTLNVAGRATVTGGGTIGTANVGASGTVIEPSTTHTAVTEGTTVTVGGETVTNSNSDKTIPKVPIGTGSTIDTGSGGSSGGGSSSSTVKASSLMIAGVSNAITTNNGTLQLTVNVTPSNTTDKSVTWSVSNPDIATISDSGLLTAKKNGTVTVTATSNSVSTVKNIYPVTITGQTEADNSKVVSSFAPVNTTLTGCVHDNDVQYTTAAEVEAALPTTVTATMADGSVKTYNVIWAEKILGQYSPNTGGVCEFVGTIQLGDEESLASNTVVPKAYVTVNSTDAQPVEVSVTTGTGIAGQKLSTLTPSGVFNDASGKPLDGTLEWASGDTVLTSGTHTYTYKFTPANTDYSVLNGGVSVTVSLPRTLIAKDDIKIKDNLYESRPLSDTYVIGTVINADGQIVDGTFSWENPNLVVTGNAASYNWIFTPSDTAKYNVLDSSLMITGRPQAETRYEGTVSATDIHTGQTLADSVLSCSGRFVDAGGYTLPGTLHWSPVNNLNATIDTAGIHTYSWEFVPDNHQYRTLNIVATVNVVDGTGLKDVIPGGITVGGSIPYVGTELSKIGLGATFFDSNDSVVVGTLAWVTPTQKIGTSVADYNWVFTPRDSSYKTITGKVSITPAQAPSADTSIKGITVTIGGNTIPAVPTSDATVYNLTVPAGTNIAALGQSFTITPNGTGAMVNGNLILDGDGHTWIFTIIAQDGSTTANYDINVTAVTTKPIITSTPTAGDTTISGTCEDGATVLVTINSGDAVEADVELTNWSIVVPALEEGDTISVTAQKVPNTMSEVATKTVVAPAATVFNATADISTLNTVEVLGVVGTTATSNNQGIATVFINTDNGTIVIESVAEGSTTIYVTDGAVGSIAAEIPVTVSATGEITLGTIKKYEAALTFNVTTDTSVANTVEVLGVVGTTATSSDTTTAKVAIDNGFIAITSRASGVSIIEVTDGAVGSTPAQVVVTVNVDGSISIGSITKYVAAPAKQDQSVPSGIGKTDVTSAGNDGTITGVNDTMEYRLETNPNYTPVGMGLTTVTGLSAGTYYIRYDAKEGFNAGADAIVRISEYVEPQLTLTCADIKGTVGVEITPVTATSNLSGEKTWSSNELPAGLSISADGVISGTPTASGEYHSMIAVTNGTKSDTASIDITIAPAPVSATVTCENVTGTVGEPIESVQAAVANLDGTITWSATGLPVGLSIDPSTGLISGTVGDGVTAKTYTVIVTANNGVSSATMTITATIVDAPKSDITSIEEISVFGVSATFDNISIYTVDLAGVDLEANGVTDINTDGSVTKADITESDIDVAVTDEVNGETYEVTAAGAGSFTIQTTSESGSTKDYTLTITMDV